MPAFGMDAAEAAAFNSLADDLERFVRETREQVDETGIPTGGGSRRCDLLGRLYAAVGELGPLVERLNEKRRDADFVGDETAAPYRRHHDAVSVLVEAARVTACLAEAGRA